MNDLFQKISQQSDGKSSESYILTGLDETNIKKTTTLEYFSDVLSKRSVKHP